MPDLNDLNTAVPDRLVSAKERRTIIPYSDMQVLRLEKDEKFPRRIRIGPNRVAWRLSELLAWIEEKPRGAKAKMIKSAQREGATEREVVA